jgi:hypothetical protein
MLDIWEMLVLAKHAGKIGICFGIWLTVLKISCPTTYLLQGIFQVAICKGTVCSVKHMEIYFLKYVSFWYVTPFV